MQKVRLICLVSVVVLLSSVMAQPAVDDNALVVETIFSTGSSPQPIMFEFFRPDDPSEFFVAERLRGGFDWSETGQSYQLC